MKYVIIWSYSSSLNNENIVWETKIRFRMTCMHVNGQKTFFWVNKFACPYSETFNIISLVKVVISNNRQYMTKFSMSDHKFYNHWCYYSIIYGCH
jgi:hypothetical protein